MTQEYNGINPVIGVILMVAITVILAAIVATFVFGLGGEGPVSECENKTVHLEWLDGSTANYTVPCNWWSGSEYVDLHFGNVNVPKAGLRYWYIQEEAQK